VLLHARAPVVLDLVVRAPREVLRDLGPAVAPPRVQLQDEQLLLRRDVAAPEVRAEVVQPPEAAALAGALQPCMTGTHKINPRVTSHHCYVPLLIIYADENM
jgi:hypothetical protein